MTAGPGDVFFYGTLLDMDVLTAVLRTPVAERRLTPARLSGHRRAALRGRPYPAVFEHAGSDVDGLVMKGCTAREWARLVEYEGPEYTTASLDVQTPDGPTRVRVFMGGPALNAVDTGEDWRFDDWLKRHKRTYVRRLR